MLLKELVETSTGEADSSCAMDGEETLKAETGEERNDTDNTIVENEIQY